MVRININQNLANRFRNIIVGLTLVFATMFTSTLHATHIVGGELTYECLGGDQYEVKLTVYRDCFFGASDAPFDDPASIGVFNGTTGFRLNEIKLPLTMVDDTIDAVIADTCLFVPPSVCVHTTFYTGIVSLPQNPQGYTLAYQRCCRNQTILNIVDPLSTGATFMTFVSPEALEGCNSQATYDDWPPIFICVNEPIDYSSSATDADGDQLIYRLCTPFIGGTLDKPQPVPPAGPPFTEVEWNTPTYDLTNMLGGPNPMTIDPQTGFITGIPPTTGQFVVGVCVEEWRNGVKIAETRRDFQYNVGLCGVVASVIGNAPVLCDNLTINFDNQSTNSASYIWDFGDHNNPGAGSTDFEPTYTYSETGTYTVTLITEPGSACSDTLEFELVVKNTTVEADFDTHVYQCGSGNYLLELEDLSNEPDADYNITNWFWQVSDGQTSTNQYPSFILDPADVANATVSLTVNSSDGCNNSVTYPLPTVDPTGTLPNDVVICLGSSVELFPDYFPNSALSFSWSPTTGLDDPNIANPTANPSVTTTYTVTVSDPTGSCVAEVPKVVTVSDYSDLELSASITDSNGNTTVVTGEEEVVTCESSMVTISTTTSNTINSTVEWYDSNGDLVSTNPQITVNPDGTVTYTVVLQDEFGCSGTAELTIRPARVEIDIEEIVNPGGGSGVEDVDLDGTLDICVGETTTLLINNLDNLDNSYEWTASPGIISAGGNTNNPTIFGVSEGVFTLTIETTNQFGCSRTDEVLIQVHNVSELNIQADVTDLNTNTTTTLVNEEEIINCNENSTITLYETSTNTSGNTTIVWTDENGNVLGTGDDPIDVSPLGDFTYTVTVTDIFGCSSSKDITVLGNPVDVTIQEVETTGGGSGLEDLDGDGDFDLCLGSNSSFTVVNNNPGDQNTYQWTGDVQIISFGADSANPALNPTMGGIYTLSLLTTNQYGCTQEDEVVVEVLDIPVPNLNFTTEQDCAGTTINFISDNPAYEYYIWNFGDGSPNVIGEQSPSHTYPAPGNYTATLIPVNNIPCALPTFSQNVQVAATLVDIDFDYDYVDCNTSAVTIQFTDLTTVQIGSITGWEWTFSDGQISNAQNPVITINQNTSLMVTLTVTNSANCDGSAVENLDINILDDPNLPTDLVACPNEGPVNLNPNGNSSYTYSWSPSIGLSDANAQNPLASPTATTTYSVTITDNSGADACEYVSQVQVIVPDPFEINIDANGTDTGVFTIDNSVEEHVITTCTEQSITVSTTTTVGSNAGYDIEWTDSDGNVLSNTNSITLGPGETLDFIVTYTDQYGCTETREITVEGGPVESTIDETVITEPDGNGIGGILTDGQLELCLGQSFIVTVTNLDPEDILSYAWSGDVDIVSSGLNSSSIVVDPSEAGSYILDLLTTNQFGCTLMHQLDVNVIDAEAVLSFEEIKDCDGVTVLFTNTSTGNNDDYLWDFGDPGSNNNSSTEVNPTHTYPGVGTYPVSLVLETNVTCVDDFNQDVEIVSPILASNFSYDLLDCDENGMTIQFNDESINPQSNTVAYEWNIGGEIYATQNPQVTFTEDEDIVVTLTIFTAIDCESTSQEQLIEISIIDDVQSPGIVLACENDGPQQINLNGDPDYIYNWTPAAGLDDPTSPNPIADPGVTTLYTVSITDNLGSLPCTIVREVEVFVPASIDIDLPSNLDLDCEDSVEVTAESETDNLNYEWFDADGVLVSSTDVLSVTGLSGDNVYTVVATDENGCTQSEMITITGTLLDIDIEDVQYICLGEEGEITVITSNDPNDILTISWDGPNIISGADTSNPIINTDTPFSGTYVVNVENQYGCSLQAEVMIAVLDTAIPNVTRGQCEGLTVNFFNDSQSAEFFTWDFGDGTSSTEANPIHTYPSPGSYTVTLSLPDGTDCVEPITFDITVEDEINFFADFTFNYDKCDNEGIITFTDISESGNQGNIINWDWEFDPLGTTSIEQNPVIMVGENTDLTVTLTITTDGDCEESVTKVIPIVLIDTQVDIEDQLECVDKEVCLNENPNEDYTYEWSPSDGLSGADSSNPKVIASSTTVYTVTITDPNQGGCTSVQMMTLEVPEVINLQVTEDQEGCAPIEIDMMATSDVADVDFLWSLEPTFNDTYEEGPTAIGESGRPNKYYVLATDEFGCIEMDTVCVANYEVLIDPNDDTICFGDETEVQIINQLSGSDELTYLWSGGGLTGVVDATPLVSPLVTTEYQVEVTNQFGCTFSETVTIEVVNMDELITSVTPATDTLYDGNETQINVTENDGFGYSWSPADGLNESNIPDPIASPEVGETEYVVTVTDSNGCQTIRSVAIVVLSRGCDDPFIFFPNAFSPNDDGENDRLRLRANQNFVDEVFWMVYNRWGEKVFEANDLSTEWDGVFEGELVQPDVYGFYLRVNCTDGQEYVKKGNVTILR